MTHDLRAAAERLGRLRWERTDHDGALQNAIREAHADLVSALEHLGPSEGAKESAFHAWFFDEASDRDPKAAIDRAVAAAYHHDFGGTDG